MKCNRPPCEEASSENCNKLFSVDPNNSCQDSASAQEDNLGIKTKKITEEIYVSKTKLMKEQ